MALFSRTKKAKTESTPVEVSAPSVSGGARNLAYVLRHARITEKASERQAAGVYVFDIDVSATKRDVMQAIKKLYSVTPRKIAVVTVPRKNVRSARTGKSGVKGGGKKAYVYLKSGETITIG